MITTNSATRKILMLSHLLALAERYGRARHPDNAALEQTISACRLDLDQATFWLYQSLNYTGLMPASLYHKWQHLTEVQGYIERCHRSLRIAFLIVTDVSPPLTEYL